MEGVILELGLISCGFNLHKFYLKRASAQLAAWFSKNNAQVMHNYALKNLDFLESAVFTPIFTEILFRRIVP